MAFFIRATLFIKNPDFKGSTFVNTDFEWRLEGINTPDTIVEFGDGVVFLNFWATWCPPCIAEMPSIDKLYEVFKNDVGFFLVSSENKEVIQQYVNQNNYSFPLYRSTFSPEFVKSNALPTTYVLKNSEIKLIKKGASNWNSSSFKKELQEIIDEN